MIAFVSSFCLCGISSDKCDKCDTVIVIVIVMAKTEILTIQIRNNFYIFEKTNHYLKKEFFCIIYQF